MRPERPETVSLSIRTFAKANSSHFWNTAPSDSLSSKTSSPMDSNASKYKAGMGETLDNIFKLPKIVKLFSDVGKIGKPAHMASKKIDGDGGKASVH